MNTQAQESCEPIIRLERTKQLPRRQVKDEYVGRGGYTSANCIFYELQKIRILMTEKLLDDIQGYSSSAAESLDNHG
jgi:hypothetical protein